MIKTIKDLKEFLDKYPEDTILLSYNQDDSLPELCEPILCQIKNRDPKISRAQHESLEDIRHNMLRGSRDTKEVIDFVETLKVGDNFLLI